VRGGGGCARGAGWHAGVGRRRGRTCRAHPARAPGPTRGCSRTPRCTATCSGSTGWPSGPRPRRAPCWSRCPRRTGRPSASRGRWAAARGRACTACPCPRRSGTSGRWPCPRTSAPRLRAPRARWGPRRPSSPLPPLLPLPQAQQPSSFHAPRPVAHLEGRAVLARPSRSGATPGRTCRAPAPAGSTLRPAPSGHAGRLEASRWIATFDHSMRRSGDRDYRQPLRFRTRKRPSSHGLSARIRPCSPHNNCCVRAT